MLEMNLIKLKKSDLWNVKLISEVHFIILKWTQNSHSEAKQTHHHFEKLTL